MIQNKINIYFFVFLVSFSYSQNNYNSQGERDGVWSSVHENGSIKYRGQFHNGSEFGIFMYYDWEGNLAVKLNYIDTGFTSLATIYYSNGQIKSNGTYLNKKKTLLWETYSLTGLKLSQENFKNGILHGQSIYYFDNGRIAETFYYVNGLKHGEGKLLYNSGYINMKCNYVNGLKHGLSEFYYNQKGLNLESTGYYDQGRKDSIWFFYDLNGEVLRMEKF